MHHILLVEDSTEYQTIVSRSLGHHKITCVSDVDSALEAIDAHLFDLILLDIQLPKRNGYSLLHELQAHPEASAVPVICLTGQGSVTDKVTAFSLGVEDYIV